MVGTICFLIELNTVDEQHNRAGEGHFGGEMLPIVVVEFCDVRLNTPIDPQQFEYRPVNVDVVDTTQPLLKGLGLKQ